MSSKLFKLRVNLLELLLTLLIHGNLLVNELLHKSFKVGFRLGRVESLLFHRKSEWIIWFGIWLHYEGLDH